MAKLLFCFVTENVVIDSTTNLLSAINIVEKVQTPSFPASKPIVYLVAYWKKETDSNQAEGVRFRVILKQPNHRETNPPVMESEGQIPAGNDFLRLVFRMEGIRFDGEGVTEFIIRQNVRGQWQKAGSFPLLVSRVSA
ncbi:hypothetical protein H3C66_01765 [Patescibacteria group bacterium]|nr:hypothetical protein [Patescibacteria group bacterium]